MEKEIHEAYLPSVNRKVSYVLRDSSVCLDLVTVCDIGLDTYDINDVVDTKVMPEYQTRLGDDIYISLDGVRQLYRRPESRVPFAMIEDIKDLERNIRQGIDKPSDVSHAKT